MGSFDIAILVVVLGSIAIGLVRGLVRELLSLISWVLAFWLALVYSEPVSSLLDPYVTVPLIKIGGAFAVIFVVTLLSTSLIGYLLYKLFSATGLKGPDRSLGAIFGLVRGCVIIALFVSVAGVALSREKWWQNSMLVAYSEPLSKAILNLMPPEVVQQLSYR